MSTLPPLMSTPMRWPFSCAFICRAAAKPRQPVGSTTSFMRSAKKRMQSTSWASVAVNTSFTSRRMIAKVWLPSCWVCAPSARVLGTSMWTSAPERNDCCPSLPASGSTP